MPGGTSGLLLYCRPGFEKECAGEVQDHARTVDVAGYVKAKEGSGFVLFNAVDAEQSRVAPGVRFADLIFARQLITRAILLDQLPVTDRVAPLLDQARRLAPRYSAIWLETADTDAAKELSTFTRKLAVPLKRSAIECGLLEPGREAVASDLHSGRKAPSWIGRASPAANGVPQQSLSDDRGTPRLHLLFVSTAAAFVGLSSPANSSPWFMGIPRLKFPRGAPSRSTLKLEEAFLTFLACPEASLRPGMTAVDLGAAPGGWTWQLVRRHLQVIAVDNGRVQAGLLESGLVHQVYADAFRYRPAKPVDWMVCDVVEQPARIAALVGRWLAEGWCRQSIFNLKLPMKRRYEEVQRCRDIIAGTLSRAGVPFCLRLKQLYHDREEVTGFLQPQDHPCCG